MDEHYKQELEARGFQNLAHHEVAPPRLLRLSSIPEMLDADISVSRFLEEVDISRDELISLLSAQALSEPCPVTSDAFLGEPGKLSNVNLPQPPNGTYTRVSMVATSAAPQRLLVKQSGNVVARYYGDLADPRGIATFFSDGTDIEFEFQQCVQFTDGSHGWRPFINFVTDQSTGENRSYLFEGGGAKFVMEFGPDITPPPPPAFLHVDGKLKCGGFGWQVATSYAYAWTTATPDRNGPRIAVPNLAVSMVIGCRQFSVSNSGHNISNIETSEQFRGIGVPVCCDFDVVASATGPDGAPLSARTTIHES